MRCDEFRELLVLETYGELDFDQEGALEAHLALCAACQAEKKSLIQMHSALDTHAVEPSIELLSQCRRDLRRQVAVISEAQPSWWEQLPAMFAFPGWAWKPAAAMGLLAAGFFGARLTTPPFETQRVASGTPIPAVRNVRFIEPGQDGNIRIVYDEVRRKEVAGSVDDHAVSDMLLAAARNPEDAGLRVDSVEYLKDRCEREDVRKTLVRVLETDGNESIRLKALDALKGYAGDAEVRSAISRVLIADKSAVVRTHAIDLLVKNQQNAPELAGVLQELMNREQNSYIRQRSQTALRAMNASLETF